MIADPESENLINEDAEVAPQRKRGGKKCKIFISFGASCLQITANLRNYF